VTPALRVGLASLALNPLRTALSTLGIIVGTAALVAVLALGDGVERYVRRQIERTTDLQAIVVTPRTAHIVDGQRIPRSDYPVFTAADADTARGLLGPGGAAVLTLSGPALVAVPDSAARAALVTATEPGITDFQELELAHGRFFTAAEAAQPAAVAVVSHRLAAERGLRVGDSLRLGARAWAVVGVLAGDSDERVLLAFVPLALARDALVPIGETPPPVLIAKAGRVEDVDTARARLEGWLARRAGADWKDKVSIGTRAGRLAQVQQGMLVFKILMGAITGISLVVGGIGIMNVLLASVAERTREIGIRKAVGARRRDILWQFLVESVAITAAGSAVGAAVGLAGAFAVTAVMRARTEALVYAAFTWGTVLVAAAAAVAVGIAFGMYPALRAARLSPIDAIRHE
jgi:putative ABC transport system permease protein